MPNTKMLRERLSIDVFPDEHKQIKVHAALYGKTIRDYVVESVLERIRRETEERELSVVTTHLDQYPVLKKL
ncbi:MAG: hypothetical protein HY934_00175 [Candidatus Firestonebacteria bacterium]|nr:hypothetical protein [Candidatus Firestonebacteria bacterium]